MKIKKLFKKTMLLIAAACAIALPSSAQTFGGVQTNFANLQCPTNSGYVFTNVNYLGLPTKTLIITNLWPAQSNFTGSWVIYNPATTNAISFKVSFAGGTNSTFTTNIFGNTFQTNYFFWHADPGTNGSGAGVYFTNGIYVN